MKKEMKYIAIFAIPHVSVVFFCLLMIFTKTATPYIFGFGVDSKGRVYVGENEGVCIYQDEVKIGSIEISSDNYRIDIDEGDSVRIVYTSRVDWLDSSGNVIKTMDDPHSRAFASLSSQQKRFVAANGDTYTLIGQYGWTRIVNNNFEIVYSQSVLSFLVKILLQICVVSMLIGGIWVVYRVKRMKAS